MEIGIVHHDVCPLCENRQFDLAFDCHDDLLTHERFCIMRCTDCGFLFTQDSPTEDCIQRYYASERYIPHDIKNSSWIMRLVQSARNRIRLPRKKHLVEHACNQKTGTLLDIGCGSGEFPLMMLQAGWTVSATEQNADMCTFCVAQGIHCSPSSSLSDFPSASMDAVTLWHVLEHMHDLHGSMEHVRRLLSTDGAALIAVPNMGGPLMRYYGTYDVPRHLWHFSPDTFKRLASLHHLYVSSMHVLHLDPLYMGLYYERMSGGVAIRGIILGFFDILYSFLRPARAASIVYVLKKLPDHSVVTSL